MPLVNIKKVLLDGQNNWSSQTTIKFAGDDGFIGATERWTTFNPPTFVAAVSPATEEDVVKTVCLEHFSIKAPILNHTKLLTHYRSSLCARTTSPFSPQGVVMDILPPLESSRAVWHWI